MRRQLKLRLAASIDTKLPFLDTTAERVVIETLALVLTAALAPGHTLDDVLATGQATTHALSVLIRAALGLLDERELLQRIEFSLMVRVVNFSIPVPFSAGLAPTLVEELLAVTEEAIEVALAEYLEAPEATPFIPLLEAHLVTLLVQRNARHPPATAESLPLRIERALLSAVVSTYFRHGADPRKVETTLALFVQHRRQRRLSHSRSLYITRTAVSA
ncbi:hypothetical protein ACHHYP_01338 [Achlya hypogyna]|uniref:Uncharacterized protein n=1 Tax=Achlya hypogyna TaxID=1202772 RepID=A0A1V9ZTG9_ACHHY|nr:hypothetical protein ACHHYP_01338 [Achlya hypogyna]